jgi:hypothetical protein
MKQLLKVFLTLIILSAATLAANAQYKLKLTDLQIKTEEAGKYEKYADKEANMTSDLPINLLLFKNNDVSYYTCFFLAERGKKFRLVSQEYVMHNGTKYKGERQVIKYKIEKDRNGRLVGVSEQDITYNKNLNRTIHVVFRYELLIP